MAVLVVRNHTALLRDIVRDARIYKRGDIVDILIEGASLGRLTLLSHVAITVSDLTMIEAQKYLQPQVSIEFLDDSGRPKVIKRRLFGVQLDNLPARIKQDLTETQITTTTKNELFPFIQNKFTRLTER